jgi:hypothetical protein
MLNPAPFLVLWYDIARGSYFEEQGAEYQIFLSNRRFGENE